MESKTCSMCNPEKHIEDFHKNYAECKDGITRRVLKCFSDKKGKISNQRTIYCEKKMKNYSNKKMYKCIFIT